MALDQWNPFLSLRDSLESLLQEYRNTPGNLFDIFGQRAFPLDLTESETHFALRAPLPGMNPADVEITLQGDLLTISGTMPAEPEEPGQRWLIQEQRTGPFQRVLRLPAPVNADQAKAHMAAGILTLTLPKAEAAKAQHITLTGQTEAQTQAEPSRATPRSRTDEQVRKHVGLNRVEEASQESFPASDAPSWAARPQD